MLFLCLFLGGGFLMRNLVMAGFLVKHCGNYIQMILIGVHILAFSRW